MSSTNHTPGPSWECPNCGADQPMRDIALPCSECGALSPDNDGHTPGPWETTAGPEDTDLGICDAGGGDLIATIHTGKTRDRDLIAAAPDMFDALALEAALEDANAHDADTRWRDVRKMKRAALAKAKGDA